jgi:hypothetical protein
LQPPLREPRPVLKRLLARVRVPQRLRQALEPRVRQRPLLEQAPEQVLEPRLLVRGQRLPVPALSR